MAGAHSHKKTNNRAAARSNQPKKDAKRQTTKSHGDGRVRNDNSGRRR